MMSGLLDQLRRQLDEQFSPIEGFGLIAIVSITAWFALMKLSDYTASLKHNHQAAALELAQLEDIRADDSWTSRLAQSKTARGLAEQRQWKGRTPGIIAANLQQKLRAVATKNKMENWRPRVEAATETIDGLDVQYFEFNGLIRGGNNAASVLTDLAADNRMIIVRDVQFSVQANRQSMLTVRGIIPVSIDNASVTGGEQ